MTILLTSQQILNRFKKFPRTGCVAVDGDVTEGCFDDVQIYFSVRCDVLLNCGAVDGRVNLEVSNAAFPVLRQAAEVHGGYHVVRPRRGAPGRRSHVAGVDGKSEFMLHSLAKKKS